MKVTSGWDVVLGADPGSGLGVGVTFGPGLGEIRMEGDGDTPRREDLLGDGGGWVETEASGVESGRQFRPREGRRCRVALCPPWGPPLRAECVSEVGVAVGRLPKPDPSRGEFQSPFRKMAR